MESSNKTPLTFWTGCISAGPVGGRKCHSQPAVTGSPFPVDDNDGQVGNLDFYPHLAGLRQRYPSSLAGIMSEEVSWITIFKWNLDSHNIIPKMSRFQFKIIHYTRNQENLNPNARKRQSTDIQHQDVKDFTVIWQRSMINYKLEIMNHEKKKTKTITQKGSSWLTGLQILKTELSSHFCTGVSNTQTALYREARQYWTVCLCAEQPASVLKSLPALCFFHLSHPW